MQMIITIIILVVSAILFAIGKVRSDLVALGGLVLLLIFGILTPEEALAGFSNPVVIMMVGLFVVGGAVLQTGLAQKLGSSIVRFAGTNETRLFITVMVVTSVIGAFVSNTGTVALMMPVVVSLATRAKIKASRLLMPVAFASSIGGMLTLIGTPPNLVIQGVLTNAGYAPLSFFSFSPVGIVCIIAGIVILLPLSKMFLSRSRDKSGRNKKNGKTLEELVKEYHLSDNISVFRITPDSALNGKTISELDIHNNYGLTVFEVRSENRYHNGILKNVVQKSAGPETVLEENDIIYIIGDKEQCLRFAEEYKLEEYRGQEKSETLAFYDIGIAEIVLMPNSKLVNVLLKNSGFRDKYRINVVGIRRNGEYIMDNLPEIRLHSGDVLLIQGTWNNISKLNNEEDNWVLLGQPLEEAEKVTLDYKAPLAAIIMLLMIMLMVFDFIPVAPVTAVMIAGLLMVICGCFRNVEAAYKTINWESVVLIAAMMPLSVALEKTGASSWLSHSLVSALGESGPMMLLAGIYFTTSIMTLFISNTATAVLMAPIALSSATEMGLSPYPFLLGVTLGASMCFASPFSTPPNALVMQAGGYRFIDYVKVGLPLQILIGIIMVFVLPLIFPF